MEPCSSLYKEGWTACKRWEKTSVQEMGKDKCARDGKRQVCKRWEKTSVQEMGKEKCARDGKRQVCKRWQKTSVQEMDRLDRTSASEVEETETRERQ